MLPVIKLYNLNLELLALVDDYMSFYFVEKYADIGSCTLTISSKTRYFKNLKKGNILFLDTFKCYRIEEINIKENIVTIEGINLSYILNHRVTLPPTGATHLSYDKVLTGDIIKDLIDKCLINASESERNIDMKIINSVNLGHSVVYKSRYRNLLSEIYNLCNYSSLGFRLGIDIKNKKFVFEIYNGKDVSNTKIFSEKFDNIKDVEIVDSNAEFKNFVYLAGQGKGLSRKLLTYKNKTYTAWNRREEIIDAKELSKDEEILRKGKEILAEKCEKNSMSFILCEYDDLEIGDIVKLHSEEYDYKVSYRVVEKNTQITPSEGRSVEIIIGSPKPKLKLEKNENEIE